MDRIVIVTGGTKGIGFATAKKFLSCKDKVIILGRHECEDAVKELQKEGEVTFMKADVSVVDDCCHVVSAVMEKYGRIDVLVNAAGVVGTRGNFVDLDLSDIQNTININLMGTINLSQLTSWEMIRQRSGVIINVGSIDGFMANTESIGYHASKGGVKMLTQAMARELSPYGIRVLSVAPGWVKTGMIDKPIEEIGSRLHMKGRIILPEEIANVISMMSGVPVQRMAQAEGLKLAGMKEDLQAKVVAQDAAIEKLTKAILRSRVGLKDPNRPIGTFMFLGPTGVGKTHLAKQLAKYMFGSSDALIRIDMSEYMEKYTVSRMIGAAPGYIGYEEGGQLTEKVRRKPYSIVLLDEIEKAHPDVFNILLQVLDEGRLTDNYGRTIDFKNTVIIMTSNIGTRQLKEFGRGVGFAAQARTDDNEHSRSVIQKALNKTFAPEFLNRLDEIITFDQLSLDAITKIVDIELKGLYGRVEAIGYKMVVDDEAKRFLATKGYDVQFGARPLKRAIQNYLEDGLSELIISAGVQPGDTINVSVNKEKNELDINKV